MITAGGNTTAVNAALETAIQNVWKASTVAQVNTAKQNGIEIIEDLLPIVYTSVDLGLPSGRKWASTNVGARHPEDNGLYFAWGETIGYKKGSGHGFFIADYPYDKKDDLDLAHDAARANMGGSWRMPSKEEFVELCANCYAEWTDDYNGTGKAGIIFYSCANNVTGKGCYYSSTYTDFYGKIESWRQFNGSSYNYVQQPDGFVAYTLATPHIFLPSAGIFENSALLSGEGTTYCYWTSSGYSLTNTYSFSRLNPMCLDNIPSEGGSVRAVLAP